MKKILFFGVTCLALYACEEPEITTHNTPTNTSSKTPLNETVVLAALDQLPHVQLDHKGEFDRSQLSEEILYKVDNCDHSVLAGNRLYLFNNSEDARGFAKIWAAYNKAPEDGKAANSRTSAGIPAVRFYKHAKYENGKVVFPKKSRKLTINGFKDVNRYLRVERPGVRQPYSAPYQLHDRQVTSFSHLGKEIKPLGSNGLWEYDLKDKRYEKLPRNEEYPTYPYINNQISGLDINNKGSNTAIMVTLYQKKDFEGRSAGYILPASGRQSLSVVSSWMNDRTSSIVIEWNYDYEPASVNSVLCAIFGGQFCDL